MFKDFLEKTKDKGMILFLKGAHALYDVKNAGRLGQMVRAVAAVGINRLRGKETPSLRAAVKAAWTKDVTDLDRITGSVLTFFGGIGGFALGSHGIDVAMELLPGPLGIMASLPFLFVGAASMGTLGGNTLLLGILGSESLFKGVGAVVNGERRLFGKTQKIDMDLGASLSAAVEDVFHYQCLADEIAMREQALAAKAAEKSSSDKKKTPVVATGTTPRFPAP